MGSRRIASERASHILGWGVVALSLVYVATRVGIAATHQIVRSPDSICYETVSLSAGRSLIPSLLFTFTTNRVAVVAAAIGGGLAVVSLALVIGWFFGATFQDRRLRFPPIAAAAAASTLVMGLSRPLLAWDLVVYTESLSISALIMVAAAWLLAVQRPERSGAWAATGFTVGLLALCRESAVFISLPLGAAVIASALALRYRRLGVVAGMAVWIVMVSGLALSLAGSSTTGTALSPSVAALTGRSSVGSFEANWIGIYYDRIVADPTLLRYTIDHGIPQPSTATLEAWRVDPSTPLVWSETAVLDWARTDGTVEYAKLLLSNPRHALVGPLEPPAPQSVRAVVSPTTSYAGSNLSAEPGRALLPRFVEHLIWQRLTLVSMITASVLFAIAAAVRRHRRWAPLFALAVVIIGLANAWLVWHGSSIEYERHGIVVALLIRLALCAAALFSGVEIHSLTSNGKERYRSALTGC